VACRWRVPALPLPCAPVSAGPAAAAAATGKGKRKRKRGRAAATARAAVHLPGSADELLDRPGGLAPVTIVSCERLGCRASRDHHCLADRPRLSLRAAELPLSCPCVAYSQMTC
jgi:hypothetical protein